LDRSNRRSTPWASIGLSIVGVCQLLLGAIVVRNIARFLLSDGLRRSSEAIGPLLTATRLSVSFAILAVLIVSGVGLLLRSFLLGLLPALVFAGLLLLSQVFALIGDQPVRWAFVAYAVVASAWLLTCYHFARPRDPVE
jgi:heme A synthase